MSRRSISLLTIDMGYSYSYVFGYFIKTFQDLRNYTLHVIVGTFGTVTVVSKVRLILLTNWVFNKEF